MLDGFCENIVVRKKGIMDYLMDVGIFLASILAVILLLFLGKQLHFNAAAFVLSATAFVFGIRAIVLHKWEYEYTVTAGEVDIDRIMARRSRKRMLSFRAEDCEIIAPANKGNYFAEYANVPTSDYSAYRTHPDNYFAVFERAGQRILVIFQPNEAMLQMLKKHNPRHVFVE
ncbi:MAG: hypothetical protein PUB07_02120 [Clostridia bacterium]|nr:hypothetical protein [Clostridia bacterium]